MSRAITKEAFFQTIGYEPHPRQWLFHRSQARFKVPCCGRRFGKSTMAGRDLEPELFLPKQIYWIVGPTYDLGEKEFRVIYDDLLVGQRLIHDKRTKFSYNKKQGNMYIEFPWQTRVEVRSADHPEALVGEKLSGAIMSEAAKHKPETWERFVRPALGDLRGWASFPTTPEGQNWLYRLWQLGRNPDFPEYDSWQFPSWDNPAIYPGGREDPEIRLIERTTGPDWFEQEIAADFTAFVGKIYANFTEQTHVQKVEYNPAWPNYIAFDFGYTRPLAAIEFQVDPQDNVYVWREHYKAYETIPAHVNLMKSRDQPYDYRINCGFADAADPEGVEMLNQLMCPTVALPEAKANWREGIDLVKTFLAMKDTGLVDSYDRPIERPRLVIDHSCTNLIHEFNNYRAKDTNGTPKTESNTVGAADRQDDHALDALRYGLMHLFRLGAGHHLGETIDYEHESIGGYDEEAAGYFTAGVRF